MGLEFLDVIEELINRPIKKTARIPLWALHFIYAWISMSAIWYIFFSTWPMRGGSDNYYTCGTITLSIVLTMAFFCGSDGNGWRTFATTCLLVTAARLFVFPVYTVASAQLFPDNSTHTPDYAQDFAETTVFGPDQVSSDIRIIWFVHYYNFMLLIVSMQRVVLRNYINDKKQKIYAETVKDEEAKQNEKDIGPQHI